jgi:FolB domain-containing protein
MDKILIQNLHVIGILGVNYWERTTFREIIINVEISTDTRQAGQSDEIADCVNYSTLANGIRDLVERSRRYTVEALAEDIASYCLNEPGISQAKVRVDKPGAIKGAESVAIEISRSN